MAAGDQRAPRLVRGVGPVTVQHCAVGLSKPWMDSGLQYRVRLSAATRRPRGIAAHLVLNPTGTEVHAERVEVTRASTKSVGSGGNLDILVDCACAAGTTQVVAGDARLPVENRSKPVTTVASRVVLNPDSTGQRRSRPSLRVFRGLPADRGTGSMIAGDAGVDPMARRREHADRSGACEERLDIVNIRVSPLDMSMAFPGTGTTGSAGKIALVDDLWRDVREWACQATARL